MFRIIKSSFILIVIITFVGFGLRVYRLTSSPKSLYIDETSIGYNAFSIISTGKDEHGKFMPLFFEAFGEYKLPAYVYLTAFAQLLLGPSDLSVRLPAIIFGSFSIPLMFLFAKELTRYSDQGIRNYVPITSAFLLAISPWHIQFSRPGFEASVCLFLFLAGLYSFFLAVRKNSGVFLVISIISFVLTLYTYNSARIVTPIIFVLLVLLHFKKFPVSYWAASGAIGFSLALPFLFFALSPEGLVRARQISAFYNPVPDFLPIYLIKNYWANVSPAYLFLEGDPTIGHKTIYRMSLLHSAESVYFFLGLPVLLFRHFAAFLIIIVILLVSFIPPAITVSVPWYNPHALRAMLVLPATTFISAFGFSYLLKLVNTKRVNFVLIILYFFILSFSTYRFLNTYHNKYILNTGWDWQTGIEDSSMRVKDIEKNYELVYFDTGMPKVSLLWYLKVDPEKFLNSFSKNEAANYRFNYQTSETIPKTGKNLYVTSGQVSNGKFLEYVYYPNGEIAYGIWVI